jgi:hypothetical protein
MHLARMLEDTRSPITLDVHAGMLHELQLCAYVSWLMALHQSPTLSHPQVSGTRVSGQRAIRTAVSD